MRRKNRKWVALAGALYLFVWVSAFHWGSGLRVPEGNIFIRIEREGIRRLGEEKARAEQQKAPPPPTGEARLTMAGPAYVAARYDTSHVVFIVATDTESRFSNSPFIHSSGTPTKLATPAQPAAPLAGLQELWEPDSHSLHFFPEVVQKAQPGQSWVMNLSPDASIPVVIERVIIAPTGCSLALGFLASVAAEQQPVFTSSRREYFVVRRAAVEPADPPVPSHIAELPGWKASPAAAKAIEQQLNGRMKEEVAKIDATLIGNALSPGATSVPLPIGDARPRMKEWLHADQGLLRDEGTLDYDSRAFMLTPDGAPRVLVRARWRLAEATAFLMSAWFRADPSRSDVAPVLLWTDSTWSSALRAGEAPVSLGDGLDFQTILNEFDADHDGWAELLIHSYDTHSWQPATTSIAPYLYTDKGLVPMKMPLRRDADSPQSCLDP
jgi:hypothetical protein